MSTFGGFPNIAGLTEIQKFYAGKSVFITGGTGFIGKIYIEKLLRSCPGLDSIYLLVRCKKDTPVQARLDSILKQKIFQFLSDDQKSLVHAMEGELGLPNLGLSSEDQKLLKNKINIVIHCAANVRFDCNIKFSININVQGTLDVLDLCREMPNIKSIVYVSTAFSNSNRTTIGECFYEPGLDPELALALAKVKGDDDPLKIIQPLILNGWPNTYAFTKAIAENLIKLKGKGLPITIVRPSIVLGLSYLSPMPGYVDNILGPTSLIMGVMVGVVRTLRILHDVPAAIVPGDLCINSIIVAAWHAANHSYEEPIIFNFVTSKDNFVTWPNISVASVKHARKHASESMLWYPEVLIEDNYVIRLILTTCLHLIPASLIDSILHMLGKQTHALKLLRRMSTQIVYLNRFACTGWNFSQKNMKALVASLSPADSKIFNIDLENFDWTRNLDTLVEGIGHNILKVPKVPTAKTKSRIFRMKLLHNTVRLCFYTIIILILWKIVNIYLPSCMHALY